MVTSWRRVVMYAAAWICGLLCLASVVWTAGALRAEGGSTPDTAGLLVGLASVGLAVGGLWAAIRALREQRTATVIAAVLARAVLAEEGNQYKQLLGGDRQALNTTIDLAFIQVAAPGISSGKEGAKTEGSLGNMASYYRSISPGRLVITGAATDGSTDAGTGKTVLAVALVLGLAKDRVPNEPVPVRLSASSWPGGSVPDWLVTHLTSVFHLPRREARAVVDANLVLPVIDGLDEMDSAPTPNYASRAAKLLRVVEGHEAEGKKAPVVVTCRRPHYEALIAIDSQLQGTAQIEIAPMATEDICSYLKNRIGYSTRNLARWEPLLDAVTAPSPPRTLIDALNTPWRLTLAAVVYEERDPVSGAFLRNPKELVRLAETGELHGHLLDRFIKAAVNAPSDEDEQHSQRRRWDPQAVWRYLAVLAAYLHANTGTPPRTVAGRQLSGTDIVLHELWPLAGTRKARAVSGLLLVLAVSVCLMLFVLSDSANTATSSAAVLSAGWAVVAGVAAYAVVWPQPARLSLRPLTTTSGLRRALTAALVAGAFGGVTGDLYYDALGESTSGTFPYLAGDVISWPVVPGWFGFGCLIYLTLSVRHHSVSDPRSALRGDLTACLISAGLIGALESVEMLSLPAYDRFFLFRGAALIPTMAVSGVMIVIGWGFVLSLKDALPATRGLRAVLGGPAILRYVSLLLCTRGRLPWRLGNLLHCCYELGLLRAAGSAYQFRQRELQEHLATRPYPPEF